MPQRMMEIDKYANLSMLKLKAMRGLVEGVQQTVRLAPACTSSYEDPPVHFDRYSVLKCQPACRSHRATSQENAPNSAEGDLWRGNEHR